jgi:hypothetical protein
MCLPICRRDNSIRCATSILALIFNGRGAGEQCRAAMLAGAMALMRHGLRK